MFQLLDITLLSILLTVPPQNPLRSRGLTTTLSVGNNRQTSRKAQIHVSRRHNHKQNIPLSSFTRVTWCRTLDRRTARGSSVITRNHRTLTRAPPSDIVSTDGPPSGDGEKQAVN